MSCCGRDDDDAESEQKSETTEVTDALKGLSIKSEESSETEGEMWKSKTRPMYAAIWLDKVSQKRLQDIAKPVFKQRFGNHVTIVHGPSRRELDILRRAVGRKCAIRLISELTDDKNGAQLVTVDVKDNEESTPDAVDSTKKTTSLSDICRLRSRQKHHVTISTKIGVPPGQSNEVIARSIGTKDVSTIKHNTIDDAVTLYGYFGVTFRLDESLSARVALREVRREIISKVTAFIESEPEPGDTLIFPPGEVTAKERYALHNFAKTNGTIKSASDGPKSKRRFVLTKKKKDGEEDEEEKDAGKHRRGNRGLFTCSRLDIFDMCIDGCVPTKKADDVSKLDDIVSGSGDGNSTL